MPILAVFYRFFDIFSLFQNRKRASALPLSLTISLIYQYLSLFAVSCAKGSNGPSSTKSTCWLSSCSDWQIMSAYLKRLSGEILPYWRYYSVLCCLVHNNVFGIQTAEIRVYYCNATKYTAKKSAFYKKRKAICGFVFLFVIFAKLLNRPWWLNTCLLSRISRDW